MISDLAAFLQRARSSGPGLVAGAHIQDLAVDTIKIANAAVIRKSSTTASSGISISTVGSFSHQLLSLTHTSTGEEALCFVSIAICHSTSTTNDTFINIRFRRTSPTGFTYEERMNIPVPYVSGSTSSTVVASYVFSSTIGALAVGNNSFDVYASKTSLGLPDPIVRARSIMIIEPLR